MSNRYLVTASPHIRDNITTTAIMLDVLIALVPAFVAGIVVFGIRSAVVTAVCVFFSVGSEWLFEKLMKREVTVGDLSAVVTGVLLAFNLPVGIPLWQAAVGSIVAIIVVKQLFGGIGHNFANPAITARIVMLLAFSGTMTTWVFPDGVSSATPLTLIASGQLSDLPPISDAILGNIGGCIGETSGIALIIGGVYLLVRKVITWHAPVAFVGVVFVLTAILGKSPVYQVFSGGLLLGAIFMATDYTTTPTTAMGKLIFGAGCGLITVLIRVYGNYPEGVSFSILLMNIVTPYISKATRSKPFGGIKA